MTPHSFLTFIPSFAYFISHYLLLIRRKWIAEIMLWVLIGGMATTYWNAQHNMIRAVDYSSLFAKKSPYADMIRDKKIMIIGDDPGLYQYNQLAGYFLDWELSRKYFEEPDYYENLVRISKALESNPPDAIIDESNLMDGVFARMPALRERYRREGNVLWRK